MVNVAYLFPAFPVFHQTFVLWEVMGLRRNGVVPKIYSLRRPAVPQQPEGKEIAREVTYLPRPWSQRVLGANWRAVRRSPRRYGRLYLEVLKAWRTGAVAPVRDAAGAAATVAFTNRVRGWFNGHPVLYLLKSWWLVPTAVHLAEQLERDRITHLHVHWASYPATVAYVVQLVSGLPFSISAHAYDIYMVPRMLPAKLRAARFVVTCAQTNATYLKRLCGADVGDKIIVSYHGVDVNRFAPAAAEAKPVQPLTIVSCGQLERYKGMHLLIEACAQLKRRGVALECWIIGEGPQRSHLERQITHHGLGDTVRLLGARPHADIAELLRQADVFVLASEPAGKSGRRDVIANVIVEAMAAGLPVVAAHLPGVEELIDDGVTGYLFPPNSVNRLTDALAKLERSPQDRRRFGQLGRRRVLQDFDSSKNVRLLARLFAAPAEGVTDPQRMASAG